MDLETGAGDNPEAGVNMYFFIQKLRSIHPDFIITQPTFGYPQVLLVVKIFWDLTLIIRLLPTTSSSTTVGMSTATIGRSQTQSASCHMARKRETKLRYSRKCDSLF